MDAIKRVFARAYKIPTETPESDGTISWDHTTLVYAEVEALGHVGCGYSYDCAAAAALINSVLAPELVGRDALSIESNWAAMNAALRNIGRPGIGACAISALDIALWDLKAKYLKAPLWRILPAARQSVAVYGSGGFTSYDERQLADQLKGWAAEGCQWTKMKVGREASRDVSRVAFASEAIGDVHLFVDANGAYSRKQAIKFAEEFSALGVSWFEEPVSSDDLEGLRLLRDRAPAGLDICAGEYGYTPYYFKNMLCANAVDVLQADATRCGGYTGFMRAAALADAFQIPLSSHCAPAIHLPVACAALRLRHMEWFHDHVRIEAMLFDGAPKIVKGHVRADDTRHGHGLEFRRADAEKFEQKP